MEVLHFVLDSYWNTFVVLLFAALFRPIRINRTTSTESVERKTILNVPVKGN